MREFLSDKRTFVGAGVVAVVLIGILLIYGILVTPARQPYRDALAQYNNVNNALSGTNIGLNTSTADDEQFDQNVAAVQAAFASLEKENEALAKQEVLTTGEGKELYDAYSERIVAYIDYNKDVITSIQTVRPILQECSGAMDSVTENNEGGKILRECAKKTESVSDIPDADYKQLIESFHENYAALATIFEQLDELSDPDGADAARKAELEEERDQVMKNFETAGATFSSDIQVHRKQLLTTDTAAELKSYLSDKSKIF